MRTRAENSQLDVSGGFYTVSEAARLLGMEDGRRIHRWVAPTAKGGEAVVARDYPKAGKQHELSFLDLVEMRFVEHFRQQRISLQALRIAAANARSELQVQHPFATSNVRFQTDRKEIFLQTAKEAGDPFLLNLMTNQIEIYDVIEGLLAKDLEFNVEGLARLWRPAPAMAPNVIVAPVYGFGRPVISRRRLPTKVLFESWLANEGRANAVAEWFGIEGEEVDEAVRFELRPLH